MSRWILHRHIDLTPKTCTPLNDERGCGALAQFAGVLLEKITGEFKAVGNVLS
jgi:hypothetical protein